MKKLKYSNKNNYPLLEAKRIYKKYGGHKNFFSRFLDNYKREIIDGKEIIYEKDVSKIITKKYFMLTEYR